MTVSAYIGLGSNLGDRGAYLAVAVKMVAEKAGGVLAVSGVVETAPVDYTDQPCFLNQVIRIGTELEPLDLLAELKGIESELGRKPTFYKGPREIDLDILLYGDIVLEHEKLLIPHPRILYRDFVLVHLVELDPELRDPVTGRRYRDVVRL